MLINLVYISIVSLFPEMFSALNYGVVGRAIKKQKLQLHFFNPRNFTHDKYKTVDDRPYGGGPGMVLLAEPLSAAIRSAKKNSPSRTIYLSPKGKHLHQSHLSYLCQFSHLI